MYDSILVAVDGSEPAAAAAEQAIALARDLGAELSVVTAVEPHPAPMIDGVPYDPGREAVDDRAADALDRLEEHAAEAGVSCDIAVQRGPAHDVIETAADSRGVDMIAMGTHGRTGLEHALLGSTAERVLRTSSVPVLTVREAGDPATVDRVLIPTDGSDCADHATDHAIELADQYGATVHILSVVDTQSLAAAYDVGAGLPDIVDSLERERRDDAESVRERVTDHGLDYETTVLEGSPETAIRGYVDDHDIDLVTMGTHGRSGLDRFLLGSVAERTVRTCPASVLATPPGTET